MRSSDDKEALVSRPYSPRPRRPVPRWLRTSLLLAIPLAIFALWASTYLAPPWIRPVTFTPSITRGTIERIGDGGHVIDRVSYWQESEIPWFETSELWTRGSSDTPFDQWILRFVPDATGIIPQNGGTRGRDLSLLPEPQMPEQLTLQILEQEDLAEGNAPRAITPVIVVRDYLLDTPRGFDLVTLILVHNFAGGSAWAVALRSHDRDQRHVGLWGFQSGRVTSGRNWSWTLWGRREMVFEASLEVGVDSAWSGARPDELVSLDGAEPRRKEGAGR